jgi:hypothetical protein
MFVRTPRQGLRNMFGWSARVRRDTIRYVMSASVGFTRKRAMLAQFG